MALNVEAASATDIGLVRSTNEDSFGIDSGFRLYVVCDGIGGARGGEIASQLAVQTFLAIARQELESGTPADLALHRAVAAANRAVISRAGWDTCYRGMGTTLVAAHLWEDHLTVINVGDSRAYLIRAAHAAQITDDHSLVAERIRSGLMTPAQAETSSLQSVITRAIGADTDVHPDVYNVTVQPGDNILLTSDGLTRYLQATNLASLIDPAVAPYDACRSLIHHANHGGGADNITCIVVRISG